MCVYLQSGMAIFFYMDNDATKAIVAAFYDTADLIVREIRTEWVKADLIFIDAMTDSQQIDLNLIRPLSEYRGEKLDYDGIKGVATTGCAIRLTDVDDGIKSVSSGDAVLILEGQVIVFGVRKGNVRAISEPPTSLVVKGPREGFVEDLKTNMVLLRRRIRSNKLIFMSLTAGRFTETNIVVAFVKGIAKEDIVEKVTNRIKAVDTDGIVDSSAISKILEPRPYSLFKQLGNTEKPDVVADKLLDGRVAILVDGSPIAITLPFLLIEDVQVTQDSYNRNSRATFLRLMRVFAIFFALILPASYVAVQMHQYQILPLQLLITVLNASEGIPFSPIIEMLVALVFFEILGEASVRMPRHVGMALSVVGAIVLGDTAVKAGMLSSVTVLIVAISGIGIYTVPDEVGVISVLRMMLVIVGGLLGIYGILLSVIAVVAYLTSIDCYGVSYLSPFAPIEDESLRRSIVQYNLTDKPYRDPALGLFNKKRLIINK